MDGFFEIVKCHCVGNFWVSPDGKIIPVIEHDSVAFSIIEERYEDEFDLIELDQIQCL